MTERIEELSRLNNVLDKELAGMTQHRNQLSEQLQVRETSSSALKMETE